MKNITLIITNLATGGAETMLFKLLEHLDRRRFQPTVISLMGLGEVGPRIQALDIPVYTLGMSRSLPNPFLFFKLVWFIYKIQPDLVHTWMYHADLLGGLAARLARCDKVAWGIHNSNLDKDKTKNSTRMVVDLCAKVSSWLPTGILSCSKQSQVVHSALGYQADKFHIIPNGFDLVSFIPNPEARLSVRQELELSEDTPLVGLMARYDPQKNHAGFIQAAAMIHAQRPDVHFLLAGAGVDKHNAILQELMSAHNLHSNMHLLGRRQDMPRLMAAIDVLVTASAYGEAFPIVIGEAMACAVPCVVTDVGDSAYIVGQTGRVVPPGDMRGLAGNILELLALPQDEKKLLGQQARQRIEENFEIGHITRQHEEFYARMLG